MPSITTWTRLEPRPRADDLTTALQAPIADPAWLLARQWQVGEFAGTDGGTPAAARVRAEAAVLTVMAPAGGSARPFDGSAVPLEPLAEHEPVTAADRWLAVESGQHFLRLLGAQGPAAAAYGPAYIAAYPLGGATPGDPTLDVATATGWPCSPGGSPTATRSPRHCGRWSARRAGRPRCPPPLRSPLATRRQCSAPPRPSSLGTTGSLSARRRAAGAGLPSGWNTASRWPPKPPSATSSLPRPNTVVAASTGTTSWSSRARHCRALRNGTRS